MDKSRAMKVDMIQATFEFNQSNSDEGWYESKKVIRFNKAKHKTRETNWYESRHFDSIYIWYDSKIHEPNQILMINKSQGAGTEIKNDTIQTNFNRINDLEK